MDSESHTSRRDPLGRFTPTPLVADLPVMGRTIRLETNHAAAMDRTCRLFCRYPRLSSNGPEFVWRIIIESNSKLAPPWPKISSFSDDGVWSINIGQRSFLAIDMEARTAVGFLAEALAEDAPGFTSPFLATLFCVTAGALRLTGLSAGCVALEEKGLLVFGAPNNGKTTSCYLAGKMGLKFHADQGTFIELQAGVLRAWGGFWPPAFRTETLSFLSELPALTRPWLYRDLTYWYLEDGGVPASEANGVIPVSCVFLERETASPPRLKALEHEDFEARLKEAFFFRKEARFEPNRSAVCRALGQLPAYALAYGSDPSEAAGFFGRLLSAGTPFGNRA